MKINFNEKAMKNLEEFISFVKKQDKRDESLYNEEFKKQFIEACKKYGFPGFMIIYDKEYKKYSLQIMSTKNSYKYCYKNYYYLF
jgi:inorganic pyrophosphatase/exopolyphosphatase